MPIFFENKPNTPQSLKNTYGLLNLSTLLLYGYMGAYTAYNLNAKQFYDLLTSNNLNMEEIEELFTHTSNLFLMSFALSQLAKKCLSIWEINVIESNFVLKVKDTSVEVIDYGFISTMILSSRSIFLSPQRLRNILCAYVAFQDSTAFVDGLYDVMLKDSLGKKIDWDAVASYTYLQFLVLAIDLSVFQFFSGQISDAIIYFTASVYLINQSISKYRAQHELNQALRFQIGVALMQNVLGILLMARVIQKPDTFGFTQLFFLFTEYYGAIVALRDITEKTKANAERQTSNISTIGLQEPSDAKGYLQTKYDQAFETQKQALEDSPKGKYSHWFSSMNPFKYVYSSPSLYQNLSTQLNAEETSSYGACNL